MSFFPIQKRQLNSPIKNQPKIGPGHYNQQNYSKRRLSQIYAPFGSLQKKKTKQKNNIHNLGPGQYQIRGELCQPAIKKYQNSNSIIIKINQQSWSNFKSKTNRFEEIRKDNVDAPGPGYYEPQIKVRPKSQATQKMKKSHSNNIGDKIKQINLKNYIQRRKPTLFSDPIKVQLSNNSVEKPIKNKGANWSLCKQQRFSPLIKQQFTQQHKQQLIQNLKQSKSKSKKKSLSSVFLSKSIKSHFQSEIYQTNNPFKIQLRKIINYKDQRPGPGSYQNQQYYSIKSKQLKTNNKHQFFGSTVERFQKDQENKVGPGYYAPEKKENNNINNNIHDKQSNRSMIQLNNESNNIIQRHSYLPLDQHIPGPGSYSYQPKPKHRTSCRWVFGSKNPRFSQPSSINQQQQKQQLTSLQLQHKLKKQKQLEYRKQFLNNRKSSYFASTQKRFKSVKTEGNNIQVGQYNIEKYYDIGEKLKRQIKREKEKQYCNIKANNKDVNMNISNNNNMNINNTNNHTSNNNIINPILIHPQPHPFLSSVQRFKTQPSSTFDQPNPNHSDCWCLVKSVVKQVFHHQSAAFISKDKRTVVFDNKNHKNTPGVGAYNNNNKSFVKGSFNSKFLVNNQNRTKKIKVWNTQRLKSQKTDIVEENLNNTNNNNTHNINTKNLQFNANQIL